MNVSSVKNLNGETFSAVQDATLTDVVQSNSAQWGQGGTTLTGDAQGAVDKVYANSGVWLTAHQSLSNYVSKSDTSVAVGFQNNASYSFAQGEYCSAANYSFAQGSNNSANNDSFAQGYNNIATSFYTFAQGNSNRATGMYSFAQGNYNTAGSQSLAQGFRNSAYENSLAQGANNTAYNESIAQGRDNYASNKSQAFGNNTKATNNGMAIGTYNNITTGAFVIGNGNYNQRSDCFIIDHDGNVSACGKISANGVELGAGGEGNPEVESYVQTNSANIDDTVTSYQTNSGTFLTAHQAISAEEWNDCYDNVNTNSGAWGGSALPISAGPGIKVNLVDNTLVFSNDETVLYSGAGTSSFNVTENFSSFETIKMHGYAAEQGTLYSHVFEFPGTNTLFDLNINDFNGEAGAIVNYYTRYNLNGLALAVTTAFHKWALTGSINSWSGPGNNPILIDKVVGINRIAGGN